MKIKRNVVIAISYLVFLCIGIISFISNSTGNSFLIVARDILIFLVFFTGFIVVTVWSIVQLIDLIE